MVQNELVHSGAVEPNVAGKGLVPEAKTAGFTVYSLRKPRNDAGLERGPRKPKRKVRVKAAKRGPGRPPVYDGNERRIVAAALKKYGYTHGLVFLRKERKLTVSKTLARSVAEEHGITFKRGRPAA